MPNTPPYEFPGGTGWVVTRQEPDQVSFEAHGDPVFGVNIYFATAQGNSGVVFVSNARYPDIKATHAAIGRAARLADEVGNLTSASFG